MPPRRPPGGELRYIPIHTFIVIVITIVIIIVIIIVITIIIVYMYIHASWQLMTRILRVLEYHGSQTRRSSNIFFSKVFETWFQPSHSE